MSTRLFERLNAESQEAGESGDCAVKAVCIVTGLPYRDVHRTFRVFGRKKGKGTKQQTRDDILHYLGYRVQDVTGHYEAKTVKTLEREVTRSQTLIVGVRAHCVAIKDGKVHDWTQGRCHRIKYVIKVTKRR